MGKVKGFIVGIDFSQDFADCEGSEISISTAYDALESALYDLTSYGTIHAFSIKVDVEREMYG